MKRLLVVIFTALILVGVHAMPAQAAKRDTPDIPPNTSNSCRITQQPYAIVAMEPHANDYLVGRFGGIRSNSDFDMNNVNDCLHCSPYTREICPPKKTCTDYAWFEMEVADPISGGSKSVGFWLKRTYDCTPPCKDIRLCYYVPMNCAD